MNNLNIRVEPGEGDWGYVNLELLLDKGEPPFIEIAYKNVDDDFVDSSFCVSIQEAIRLHKALGKMIKHAGENV